MGRVDGTLVVGRCVGVVVGDAVGRQVGETEGILVVGIRVGCKGSGVGIPDEGV